MEEPNINTPIINFIISSLEEKNNDIRENIFLGNIHFPSKIKYLVNDEIFKSENHKIFLNNLSNKLSLVKIKEEKDLLNNKIEITNKKINILKNNINNKYNYPKYKPILKSISSIDTISNLPLLSENAIHKKNQNNLIEIKPLNFNNYKNKMKNIETEIDLQQKAKEFIKRINESKINNLSLRIQKQHKDYLKLKKQIEILDKKRKMREEFELQRKNNEKIERAKKKNINISNIKFPNKKYHYYNKNNKKILLKNFTDELADFNSQLYYNNINSINQYNKIFNKEKKEQNINEYRNERINTEGNNNQVKNNMHNMMGYANNNYEPRINNNSIIAIPEKRHLYYFNEIKYDN